jgi:polyhydroxyalkanoate synthesis regulator phasin
MSFRGTSIAASGSMANDFEQLLKDLFGEPINRITQYSSDQTQRIQTRLQEFAREAVKDELTKLHAEVSDLRERVAALEKERIDTAAEIV